MAYVIKRIDNGEYWAGYSDKAEAIWSPRPGYSVMLATVQNAEWHASKLRAAFEVVVQVWHR